MKGQMRVYSPVPGEEPKVTDYDEPIGLGVLQNAVGGYIEAVPLWDGFEVDGKVVRAVVWCNEEGKLEGLPVNRHMTDLWEKHLNTKGIGKGDVLVGSIAVVVGDDEFMAEL